MEALVPERECGSCNACCVVPLIDSLAKPTNTACRHWKDGCGIYETRPDVCRRFFCGWRRTKMIPDDWRPDRSGVFVTLEEQGVNLMLVDNPLKTVRQPWFLDFVAGAVARRIPLLLGLPGPSGMQAAMLPLNGAEMEAAARTARSQVKDVLERALKQLSGHTFVPCVTAQEDAEVR